MNRPDTWLLSGAILCMVACAVSARVEAAPDTATAFGAPLDAPFIALFRDKAGHPLFVEYQKVGVTGIFQGDIVLGRHDHLQQRLVAGMAQLSATEVQRAFAKFPDLARQLASLNTTDVPFGLGVIDFRMLWKERRVPFVFAPLLPAVIRQQVAVAIAAWNKSGIINFIPVESLSGPDVARLGLVTIQLAEAPTICNSQLGRGFDGTTTINLGEACGVGSIIHELGHTLGLGHEHLRKDRELFMTTDLRNVTELGRGQIDYCAWHDGGELCSGIYASLGSYDPCSIMHYGERLPHLDRWLEDTAGQDVVFRLSARGQATLDACGKQFAQPACRTLGQRCGLSAGDISAIKSLYAAVGG